MTKPIPAGTVNTTLNMPREERLLLGRVAHSRGLSLSALIKQCVERVLSYEEPVTAAQLRQIRNAVAKGAVALSLLTGMAAQWVMKGGQDMSRIRTAKVKTVKGKRRGEEWFLGWEAA